MSDATTRTADTNGLRRARWINRLVPGGGLILLGAPGSGWLLGLLFAACANLALAAMLLFPDDFSSIQRGSAVLLAVGAYAATQWRLAQTMRGIGADANAARRRETLAAVQDLLARGEPHTALTLLQPLAQQAGDDLLVAYRLAQTRTALGDAAAIQAAWRRVRDLDRHGVYRQHVREHLHDARASTQH